MERVTRVAGVGGVAVLALCAAVGVVTAQPTPGTPGSGSTDAVWRFFRSIVGGLLVVLGVVSTVALLLGRAGTLLRRARGTTVSPRYGTREWVVRLVGFLVVGAVGAGIVAGGRAYWAAIGLAALAAAVAIALRARTVAWRSVARTTLAVARQVVSLARPGARR